MSGRHVDPLGALYAEVLGEVAWAQGGEPLLREVGDALSPLGEAWANERMLRAYFLSAMVKADQKRAALRKLLEGAPPIFRNFVRLLLRRGRGRILDKVAVAYEDFVDRKLGRVQVTLTSATPVSAEQEAAWVDRLRETLGREPVLSTHVKPELVAGAILQVDGTVADGSARRRLNELKVRIRERGKHALQA